MTYETIQSLSTKNDKFTTMKQIVEISCNSCGYDRGILTFSDYASTGLVKCNNPNCEEQINIL